MYHPFYLSDYDVINFCSYHLSIFVIKLGAGVVLTLFIELRQIMAPASGGVDCCLTSFTCPTSYNIEGAQVYPAAVSGTESENKTKKIP